MKSQYLSYTCATRSSSRTYEMFYRDGERPVRRAERSRLGKKILAYKLRLLGPTRRDLIRLEKRPRRRKTISSAIYQWDQFTAWTSLPPSLGPRSRSVKNCESVDKDTECPSLAYCGGCFPARSNAVPLIYGAKIQSVFRNNDKSAVSRKLARSYLRGRGGAPARAFLSSIRETTVNNSRLANTTNGANEPFRARARDIYFFRIARRRRVREGREGGGGDKRHRRARDVLLFIAARKCNGSEPITPV